MMRLIFSEARPRRMAAADSDRRKVGRRGKSVCRDDIARFLADELSALPPLAA